jgi:hypothetical protein
MKVKVHYHIQKKPPLVLIMNEINLGLVLFFKALFNIILLSTPRNSKRSVSLRVS